MLTRIENREGVITYDATLMEQLISDAFGDYKGRTKILRKIYKMDERGVDIDISVYLKFGTSISKFSKDIFDNMVAAIEDNLELPVQNIKLYILGIYSKKLVKRNIVIEYNNPEIENTGD